MEKIKVIDLQKSYTSRKKESNVVLYQFNLSINPGEFIVLLGESGCGKTTLLKVLAGIESYDFGDIYFDGIDSSTLDQIDKNMSYVSQKIILFPRKTVYENIIYPLQIMKIGKEQCISRVKELSKLFNLDILLTRRPNELSGGQQQRVAIARAFAKEPSICLFDEPLSSLDPIFHEEIIDLFKHLHKETNSTFLYSTHNQLEAFKIADKVAYMNNRKIVQIGTYHDFAFNPSNLDVVKYFKSIFVAIFNVVFDGEKFINLESNDTFTVDSHFKSKLKNYINKNLFLCLRKDNFDFKGTDYCKDIINYSGSTLSFELSSQLIEFEINNDDFFDKENINFSLNLSTCPIFDEDGNIL